MIKRKKFIQKEIFKELKKYGCALNFIQLLNLKKIILY